MRMEPPIDAHNGTNGLNSHLTGQHNLRLHFANVSYVLKQHDSAETLQILQDTCGEFKAGRLTAILGASGAGKTSMLNVLSGFKATGVSGHFRLNGVERNLLAFRKMSSYIQQDFHMLHLLTVEETLKSSTDLTLPAKTGTVEKQKIIDEILKILNMEKCRHTLVGAISGGERKRLSIGIEMVTNPPVMFFDEPTSGLDSVSSYQLLKYLQRLARDGRIIVCVVHQPSSRQMKLFDDVMVLSGGSVLYSGPQSEMLDYFERDGFSCPKYYNPADYVLDVSSESPQKLKGLIMKNKDVHCKEDYGGGNFGHAHEKTKMLNSDAKSPQITIEMSEIHSDDDVSSTMIWPKANVSTWQQFTVLTNRSLTTLKRNKLSVQLRVFMHILIAVMLGVVYWQIGNDAAKVLSNSSYIFFSVLFVFFANSMPSILSCPQDMSVFVREYLNGWYSMTPYYASKIIADFPIQLICPSVFVSIVYFMTDQPMDAERFLMYWAICFLTSIVGHFLGLVIGSLCDLQTAVFIVPASTIPLMVFSGYFVRMHELPSFLKPLCDISLFRYSLEGLVQAIYGFDRKELECKQDFCYFKSPLKFLKEMDMVEANYAFDVLILFMWIFVMKISFYIVLRWRIHKAQ